MPAGESMMGADPSREQLEPDAWQALRQRFRAAEASPDRDVLPALLAQIDSLPTGRRRSMLGASSAAVGYLKRHARRLLRGLASTDAGLYADVAHRMLVISGAGNPTLDLSRQWLSVDVLFGRSYLLEQSRHGRGRYVARPGWPPRHRREEWLPQAWDDRPELVRDLFARGDLPWQVHEAARKMLPDAAAAMTELDSDGLSAFLSCPGCVLVVLAARTVRARVRDDQGMQPKAVAEAFFFGSPAGRNDLGHWLRQAPHPTRGECAAIAAHRLCRLVAAFLEVPAATRRVDETVLLLLGELAPAVRAEDLLALARAPKARAQPLIELALSKISRSEILPWFGALFPLVGSPRWRLLIEAIRREGVDATTAAGLVHGDSEHSRVAGWEVLASAGVGRDVIGGVWSDLLLDEQENPALVTARSSPTALTLLDPQWLDLEAVSTSYARRPQLVRLLSPELFRILCGSLPGEVGLGLVLEAPDAAWSELRGPCAALLASDEPSHRQAFWLAGFREMRGYNRHRAAARLVEDEAIAATFAAIGDVTPFLVGTPAVAGPLLVRWAEANPERIEADPWLLAAFGASPLPIVSDWGRDRLLERDMTPDLAVGLALSGQLEATQLGERYLSEVQPGSVEELACMLALCRSRDRAAFPLAVEWLQQKGDRLPLDEVAAGAVDHPDPGVREAVALALWTAQGSAGPGVRQFDRAVLLRPQERRRTRDLVKRRLRARGNHLGNTDLLELAHVGGRPDADWAVEELGRRAVAGAPAVGFALVGPVEDT